MARAGVCAGTGDRQPEPYLPSVTPYRKRFGGWEAALLHFGYSENDVARRLTATNNIIRKGHDPDAWLPAGLPMARLRAEDPVELALAPEQVATLRDAYAQLARRLRYVPTLRLGLAQPLTLKQPPNRSA